MPVSGVLLFRVRCNPLVCTALIAGVRRIVYLLGLRRFSTHSSTLASAGSLRNPFLVLMIYEHSDPFLIKNVN